MMVTALSSSMTIAIHPLTLRYQAILVPEDLYGKFYSLNFINTHLKIKQTDII